MEKLKKSPIRMAVFAYALTNVINYFLHSSYLSYLSLAFLLFILFQALFNMPKVNKRVCLGLFILGLLLMLGSGAPLTAWKAGLEKNNLLITLFVCSPMLNLPFNYINYQSELKNVAKCYMHTMLPFFLLISIPTHIFAALTAFAAFSIMYNLFLDISKMYNAEDIFIATLARSYATSGFWGTTWASVLLAVSELHIPWVKIIPIGLIFTAVSFAINLLTIAYKMRRQPKRYPRLAPEPDVQVHWSKIRTMLYLAGAIVAIAIALSILTPWSLLVIVPLVAFAFPPVIALLQNKLPEYKKGLAVYYDKSLYKSQNDVALFTAAGFLGAGLEVSGVGAMIPQLIPNWLQQYPVLLIAAIMLLMIIPALIGVHPVATGTALVATIVPSAIGLAVPTFAWAIICGWSITNMLSPFSALNLTLSGLAEKPSWDISLGLNLRYGMICLVVYSLMISIMGPLL